MTESVIELIGVYNASGTALGELAYLTGKLVGRAHCALCDITHGRLRRRAAFDSATRALPVPLTLLHRNELSPELVRAVDGDLPCVLARTTTGVDRLLGSAEIAACGSDPQLLVSQIVAALTAAELHFPSTD